MLTYGLKVTLLGMGTVFVALYLLMNLISVQSKFLAPKLPKQVTTPKEAPVVAEQPKPVEIVDKDDDYDEVAAVIAAAIAACGHQVVIKSITRISGSYGSAWAQSGRMEAMNLRQL